LRIQQEETLILLARVISEKMAGQPMLQPVPTKILVPALEKASLEDAADDYMIDKWAELLAAAATQPNVPPRFVGILAELTGSQAKLLEEILYKDEGTEAERKNPDWIVCELDSLHLQRFFAREVAAKDEQYPSLWKELYPIFRRRGLLMLSYSESLETSAVRTSRKLFTSPRIESLDLDVLRSLNLIELKRFYYVTAPVLYDLSYYQITDAGLSFLSVCSTRARSLLADLAADDSGKYFPPSSARKKRES
jgi:hypothetical protein